MKMFRYVMAVLGLAIASQTSFAQDVSYLGDAQLVSRADASQLVIRGPAALALFDTLSRKDGAVHAECGTGVSVVVAPLICVKPVQGETECYTSLVEGETSFTAPDVCRQPKLSIIGVGSIRTVEGDNLLDTPDVTLNLKSLLQGGRPLGGFITPSKLESCLSAP